MIRKYWFSPLWLKLQIFFKNLEQEPLACFRNWSITWWGFIIWKTLLIWWKEQTKNKNKPKIKGENPKKKNLMKSTTKPAVPVWRNSRIILRIDKILSAYFTSAIHIDRSPAFLISDDFIRSNEIIRTKWPIYLLISHFVLMISSECKKSRPSV